MEVMLFAKAISWIDDCRIPFVDKGDKGIFNKNSEGINRQKSSTVMETYMNNSYIIGNHDINDTRQQGRFPANILVCDDMLNDGVISKSVRGNNRKVKIVGSFGGGTTNDNNEYNDKGTNSRYYDIDKWFDKLLESCE